MSIASYLQHAHDRYPNALRKARTQAQITRVQLVRRCSELVAQGDKGHVKVDL